MRVVNDDDRDHDVHLTVLHEGREVVNTTWLLANGSRSVVGQFERSGSYTVHARTAAGATMTEHFDLPLGERDGASGSEVIVQDDGSLTWRGRVPT